MTRIGLIGPADRPEMIRLAIRVEERGGEGVILDSREDPRIEISGDGAFAYGVDLSRVRAVYVADLGILKPWVKGDDGKLDRERSEAALAASMRHLSAWNSLLEHVAPRVSVVNPPRTHDLHALKPWEIAVYRRKELPAPLTIATSDAAALSDLPGRPRWGWIAKGMAGGYGYTESFEPPHDLESANRLLEHGPLMVQERIEGDNVRAFVLDGRVIGAAEVVTHDRDEIDSRRGETRLRKTALPESAVRTAVAAAACWGMTFCAVDFMRHGATGDHLLLECNSAPFFVNFEKRSGCDISGALAGYLMRRPETGQTGNEAGGAG